MTGREELYATVARGVRRLLGCSACQLFLLDEGRLELAACVPVEGPLPWPGGDPSALLSGLLRGGRTSEAPPLSLGDMAVLAVAVAAGDEQLGVLVAAGPRPFHAEDDELLRSVANQVAVALVRAELIERLTAENAVRDLFAALAAADVDAAESRAKAMGRDLRAPQLLLHVERARQGRGGPAVGDRGPARGGADPPPGARRRLRRQPRPPARDDVAAVRAARRDARAGRCAAGAGRNEQVVVGLGRAADGLREATTALQEATDAAAVARALLADGRRAQLRRSGRLPLPGADGARRRAPRSLRRGRPAAAGLRRAAPDAAAAHAGAVPVRSAQPGADRRGAVHPSQHPAPAPGAHRAADRRSTSVPTTCCRSSWPSRSCACRRRSRARDRHLHAVHGAALTHVGLAAVVEHVHVGPGATRAWASAPWARRPRRPARRRRRRASAPARPRRCAAIRAGRRVGRGRRRRPG